MEDAVINKLLERLSGLESRIELYEWIGPEESLSKLFFNMCFDLLIFDCEEAPDVIGVTLNDLVSEVKDVQERLPTAWRSCSGPGSSRQANAAARLTAVYRLIELALALLSCLGRLIRKNTHYDPGICRLSQILTYLLTKTSQRASF